MNLRYSKYGRQGMSRLNARSSPPTPYDPEGVVGWFGAVQAQDYRAALWALNRDYGRKDVTPSGPLYKSHRVEGNKVDPKKLNRIRKSLTWRVRFSILGPLMWSAVLLISAILMAAEAGRRGKLFPEHKHRVNPPIIYLFYNSSIFHGVTSQMVFQGLYKFCVQAHRRFHYALEFVIYADLF